MCQLKGIPQFVRARRKRAKAAKCRDHLIVSCREQIAESGALFAKTAQLDLILHIPPRVVAHHRDDR